MMLKLKYFYLFCLLLCIEGSFCYEFINGHKSSRPNELTNSIRPKHRRPKVCHHRRRREFEEDKDPESNIDIASFIQQPDPDYDVDNTGPYELHKKRRRISQTYNDRDALTNSQSPLYEDPEEETDNSALELKHTNGFYNERVADLDAKKYDTYGYLVSNMVHDEQKKSLKSTGQKFPFFSRKKNDKKGKRKKLDFNFPKTSTTTILVPKLADIGIKYKSNRRYKRSDFERFCPLCKRRFLPKSRQKRFEEQIGTLTKMVHNSRQYYEELADQLKTKQKKNVAFSENFHNGKIDGSSYYRIENSGYVKDQEDSKCKRDDLERCRIPRDETNTIKGGEYDRDRQLKELAEVERKIDSVKVNTNTFPTMRSGDN